MFRWLKEKATRAAQRQCKFNIRLNTKTLVSIANRADAHIQNLGDVVDYIEILIGTKNNST